MCTYEEITSPKLESVKHTRGYSNKARKSPQQKLKKVFQEALNPEQDPDQHVPCTPFQELLNCVSMTLPSILCLWFIRDPNIEISRNSWVMMAGTFVHLPFSITYHGLCALGYDSEFWKRADLSFIHVTSSFYAYAFSSSPLYFAANLVLNARFIAAVWAKTGRHKAERSKNILMSVVLYLLPIAFMEDWRNLVGALSWFLLGGVSFQINFLGGYGHSIFHTVFIGFQYYLFQASQCAAEKANCL